MQSLVRAEYSYEAAGDDEISMREDELFYLIDDSSEEWWKVRAKPASADISSADSPEGLVPASYLIEVTAIASVKAAYAYEATTEEEITVNEDEQLNLLIKEEDWSLVAKVSERLIGYMPTAYIEEHDTAADDSSDSPQEEYHETQAEVAGIPPPPPPPPPPPAAFAPPPAAFAPPPTRVVAATPPPAPQVATAPTSEQYGIVQFDFSGEAHDELTVNENDRVIVVNSSDPDWWLVRRTSDQQEGLVPATYVEVEEEASTPHASIHDQPSPLPSDNDLASAASRSLQISQDETVARQLSEEEKKAARKEARAAQARELARAKGIMHDVPAPPPTRSVAAARPIPVPTAPSPEPVRQPSPPPQPAPSRSSRDKEKEKERERKKPSRDRIRIWKDRTGQFKVEAEFLGVAGGKVRLHKTNGVVIDVPIERMAPEDAAIIRRLEGKRRDSRGSDDAPVSQKQRDAERERERERRHRKRDSRDHHREDDREREREREKEREKQKEREARDKQAAEKEAKSAKEAAARAAQSGKNKKPTIDWFEFFLNAGCDIDDCSRYANNFDRDRIDEEVLPEIEASTLRSLGLREGDLIRVRKHIKTKYGRSAADPGEKSSDSDKESGSLFTNASGGLKTTRRGRPQRSNSAVSAANLTEASEELIRVGTPPITKKPEPKKQSSTENGFDDDAWTVKTPKASTLAPAPPALPPKAVTPPLVDLAKEAEKEKQSLADDILARLGVPNRSNSVPASAQQNNTQQTYNPNAPRGPVAPTASNGPLLNPLISTQTGFTGFIPTRPSSAGNFGVVPQQTGYGASAFQVQPTGYAQPPPSFQQPQQIFQQPQQTGYSSVPASFGMQAQPTGMFAQAQPMQLAPQPTGFMQPQITGFAQGQTLYPSQTPQRQMSAPMNTAMPSLYPPASQQPTSTAANRYDPSNVFAAMKQGSNTASAPQAANSYDALRVQQTGFGQPVMAMQPTRVMGQPGMMPQPTGFYQQPMQTGMPGQNGFYRQQY